MSNAAEQPIPPRQPRLHYNEILGAVFDRHREKIGKYLSGVEACDPDHKRQAKRNNFWCWMCNEYQVTNGCEIWLDLTPIEVPAWVNNVFALIRLEFAEHVLGDEIRFFVDWKQPAKKYRPAELDREVPVDAGQNSTYAGI